ncbi:MAG: signal peptidase II [Oscillospiraceae bacterium]|jgi:signal peptidase II|nr:signal peptidase II [Oscillospiraceae bacterium]
MIIALYITAIAILVIADQVLKYFVVLKLEPIGTLNFIPGFIQLRYMENTGAAFGIFKDQKAFLLTLSVFILGICFYVIFSKNFRGIFYSTGAAMMAAGGIGNIVDRLTRGFVVDFFEFTFIDFAIFNFADILVTTGAAFIIIELLRDMNKEIKSKKESSIKDV